MPNEEISKNLRVVYFTRESKKGTVYNAVDIYYGDTFIDTHFIGKTQASLIELCNKNSSSPYTD